MSTRANVHIVETGMRAEPEIVQLYHHCDGYPSNMLPLLKKGCEVLKGWEAGRAGKLASAIISTDVGQFEPETEIGLHPDIEYFYKVETHNPQGGHVGEKPEISIEIFTTHGIKGFWDAPDEKLMKRILPKTPIKKAFLKAITEK